MISDLRHPLYSASFRDWQLWRLTYESGQEFIDQYLKTLSTRESQPDFEFRKSISYCPAFAKEAIVEIKNSIYQRFNDVARIGGSGSYQAAIGGDFRGVDLIGSSINSFIGQEVLPELLTMSRVGVYVDFPRIQPGSTVLEKGTSRPYLCLFSIENICSWACENPEDPNEFTRLLLRETVETYDPEYGMPDGAADRYRYMWKDFDGVHCCYYSAEGDKVEEVYLKLPTIPFVVYKIDHSLLTDVSKYQIALLNLASADMSYAIRSNFPFYIEQVDPRVGPTHIKQPGEEATSEARTKRIELGAGQGRQYIKDLDPPSFIHPSPEPLKISMEKQEQLKQEIRQLVQLNVSSLNPNKQASAESKGYDNQGLEAGLSYIGLELERGERRIAQFWSMYEGSPDVATINYPVRYSLKSDNQRNEDAKNLTSLMDKIPSKTAQKEMCKEAVRMLLASKVAITTLGDIEKEIDSAQWLTSDYEQIARDVEMGLVDKETASKARGYPKGVVEKANSEHAERLARINEAQSVGPGARGNPDSDGSPTTSGRAEKTESRLTDKDGSPSDKTRGKGK